MSTVAERKRAANLQGEAADMKEGLSRFGLAVAGALGGGLVGAVAPKLSLLAGAAALGYGAWKGNGMALAAGAALIASPAGNTLSGSGLRTDAGFKDKAKARLADYFDGLKAKVPMLGAGKDPAKEPGEGEPPLLEGVEETREWAALQRIEGKLIAEANAAKPEQGADHFPDLI